MEEACRKNIDLTLMLAQQKAAPHTHCLRWWCGEQRALEGGYGSWSQTSLPHRLCQDIKNRAELWDKFPGTPDPGMATDRTILPRHKGTNTGGCSVSYRWVSNMPAPGETLVPTQMLRQTHTHTHTESDGPPKPNRYRGRVEASRHAGSAGMTGGVYMSVFRRGNMIARIPHIYSPLSTVI